jgi:hypothetical protein
MAPSPLVPRTLSMPVSADWLSLGSNRQGLHAAPEPRVPKAIVERLYLERGCQVLKLAWLVYQVRYS